MVPGGFEHTAPLVRGSSGGPVLDLDGKVVGIDTHRSGEGFYLARTADPALRDRIAELGEGRTVRRRRLGVALAPNEVATRLCAAVGLPERAGLLVHEVVADGPAGRAGVAAGDLLVRAGSVDLVDVDALQRVLADQTPATLDLTVVRGTEERTVTVTFEDEPAQDSPSQHEPAQD